MKKTTLPLLALIFLIACQPSKKEAFDLLIVNASVIDVEEGKVIRDQVIGISDDTIRLVTNMTSADTYSGDKVLDAENNFIMPGLWDMHVHFRGGDSLLSENKDLLPLFTAYGVTTVRDAGGDITPGVLKWREQIKNGRLNGPDIFTSGPKFDGANPAWEGSIKITKTEDISPAMDSLEQLGVDYFKIYDGSLSKEMYYALIKEAEARDMKITGHMPMNASIMQAIEYGLDGIEHLYYALNATSPVGDSLANLNKGYGILRDLVASYDADLATQAYADMASNEFYATPTLYIGSVLNRLPFDDHSQDSLLSIIGDGIQKTYERRIKSAMNRSAAAQEFNTEMRAKFVEMVKPMHDAGINLLAGSDCGASNSYVYPGASLHGELFMLVEAGLTPQEALKTSIINGPMFFGLDESYGKVDAGKVANLLVLSANPLDKIENIRSIEWVLKGDKAYDKAQLRSMINLN